MMVVTAPQVFAAEDEKRNARRSESPVLIVQGFYYLLSGLWPVFHITSFMEVTGPKTDLWLVRSFGLVVATIGLALLAAARKRRSAAEAAFLAVTAAIVLAGIDVVFVLGGAIPPIYLADAVVEAVFILWWSWVLSSRPPVVQGLRVGLV
jgi:hypothetical protein